MYEKTEWLEHVATGADRYRKGVETETHIEL